MINKLQIIFTKISLYLTTIGLFTLVTPAYAVFGIGEKIKIPNLEKPVLHAYINSSFPRDYHYSIVRNEEQYNYYRQHLNINSCYNYISMYEDYLVKDLPINEGLSVLNCLRIINMEKANKIYWKLEDSNIFSLFKDELSVRERGQIKGYSLSNLRNPNFYKDKSVFDLKRAVIIANKVKPLIRKVGKKEGWDELTVLRVEATFKETWFLLNFIYAVNNK